MNLYEPPKEEFVKTWLPAGYRENFNVYSKTSGISEAEIVARTLIPFFNPEHVALEVGCGGCYWPEKYLCRNFKQVIGLDLIPTPTFKAANFTYIEIPSKDYSCFGIADESVDFVWSFGVFCHLQLPSIQQYLNSIFRVLKPGGRASLYFSNIDRRPGTCSPPETSKDIIWVRNDLPTTTKMLHEAGFHRVHDLMPELHDTMVSVKKK